MHLSSSSRVSSSPPARVRVASVPPPRLRSAAGHPLVAGQVVAGQVVAVDRRRRRSCVCRLYPCLFGSLSFSRLRVSVCLPPAALHLPSTAASECSGQVAAVGVVAAAGVVSIILSLFPVLFTAVYLYASPPPPPGRRVAFADVVKERRGGRQMNAVEGGGGIRWGNEGRTEEGGDGGTVVAAAAATPAGRDTNQLPRRCRSLR
jgi:hypothetical protein